MYKVLSAESSSGKDTAASMAASQNPPSKSLPSKNLTSSFRESFISSGKQRGGATVLREGGDIVRRETCVATSLKVNNFTKAAVLHLASCSLQVLIGFS
jgi:hypothetical protein